MPKLHDHTIEQNLGKIEAAALRVFTRQGYHGTSVRQIADAAGVSIGNLYNYYKSKEEIFISVVRRYEEKIEALRRPAFSDLKDPFDPAELERMALRIREIVYANPDYWRLMYIDVIEFGSKHFGHTFRSLAQNLRERMGERLEAGKEVLPSGVDPALAFTAIYLQLFTYFLVEKLFGGKQHLGMPDEPAVSQLIQLMTSGLGRTGANAAQPDIQGGDNEIKIPDIPDGIHARGGVRRGADRNHGPDLGGRERSRGSSRAGSASIGG